MRLLQLFSFLKFLLYRRETILVISLFVGMSVSNKVLNNLDTLVMMSTRTKTDFHATEKINLFY